MIIKFYKGIFTRPLIFFLSSSFFIFSGCGGGDNANITEKTTTLYIKSVVYDNNATATVTDDKLFIYYNKEIDANSISADTGANFILTGIGAIGTSSLSDYNDTLFHRHLITLNNNGSNSIALIANDTNISLASKMITDINGSYPLDYNQSVVEAMVYVKKTGVIKSYDNNGTEVTDSSLKDDGFYKSGTVARYTRASDIVTDELTGFIWQDNVEVATLTKPWVIQANYDVGDYNNTSGDTATSYCSALTLGTYTDWRLPTVSELESIVDYGKLKPSIDTVYFNNVSSDYYWSSTTGDGEKFAWNVGFSRGYVYYHSKTSNYYIRCIREGK